MFAELVMLVFLYDYPSYQIFMNAFQLYALLPVPFANLHLPTAIVRVTLALWHFMPHNYTSYTGNTKQSDPVSMANLIPSMDIFYMIVLAQGSLYIVACVAEVFSIIPWRSLARRSGFRGRQGVESISLYYGTKIFSKLHTSRDATTGLINMLEWEYTTNILSAAKDILPELGMSMIGILISYDQGNCIEISKVEDLIPKIIQFTCYTNNGMLNTDEVQQKILICSSLILIRRFAITNGMSITDSLASYDRSNRMEISKVEDHIPKIIQFTCYINNGTHNTNEVQQRIPMRLFITESDKEALRILEDNHSCPQLWEPSIDIIAIFALDEDAKNEIGSAKVMIGKLMNVFLGQDGATNMQYDQQLRAAAREALANLCMESIANCLAVLEEPGYELVKDLGDMISDDEYSYVVTHLLHNLYAHSSDEMLHLGV
ncbi:hypothetical protein U9M48_015619 [Paspalum notatum var. saurae]|uniref:Uncharacterized protein n=1 Tax=Paspalum notatum var. saurae TaxID=547442 RepID=A0AAQ3T6Y6_PASNO